MGAMEELEIIYSVRDRLKNWAIACRTGWHADTCGSAEKRFKSPQTWYAPSPKRQIDYRDAKAVENAWRALPMRHKMMLKWVYVYPVHPRMAERKAKIETGSYNQALKSAEFKIALSLYKNPS